MSTLAPGTDRPTARPTAPLGPGTGEEPVEPAVERVEVGWCTIPTDAPESDGTLEWDATTIVVVIVRADGESGLGFTYAHEAAGRLALDPLAGLVVGRSATRPEAAWNVMRRAVRNLGCCGLATQAISAIDCALWDLAARLRGVPLVSLLGQVHDAAPIYGSGGFTSYDDDRLASQLAGWVEDGIPRVKMKVGREPDRDLARVAVAREAIGPDAELYVDANGAYTRARALDLASRFRSDHGVTWFEEPRPSDDLAGLAWLRARAPGDLEIAAGEYGWQPLDFSRLIDAGAVHVIQPDVTRCGGITGFRRAAAIGEVAHVPVSCHTAPALHLHVALATTSLRHIEHFHDHVRIERLLFDGVIEPSGGALRPDLGAVGHGLTLRRADAARHGMTLEHRARA